jgi:hypothetical protein
MPDEEIAVQDSIPDRTKSYVITVLSAIVISLGLPATGRADEPCERPRAELSPSDQEAMKGLLKLTFLFPQKIIDQGYTTIRGINLLELKESFSRVRVGAFNNGFLVGSGYRTTAINIREQCLVMINTLGFNSRPMVERSLTLLHEFLGASGYDDDDYQISAPIGWLASKTHISPNDLESPLLSSLTTINRIDKSPRRELANGQGGITGVGGGGDSTELYLKMALMIRFESLLQQQSRGGKKAKITSQEKERLLNAIAQVKFKSSLDFQEGRVNNPFTLSRSANSFIVEYSYIDMAIRITPSFNGVVPVLDVLVQAIYRELLKEIRGQ